MAGSAVQFFGIGPVVSAYEGRGIDTWAIFQGKDMLTSGDNAEQLRAYLSMLAPHGSVAPYKLCFYREVEPDEVRPKTECDSSFGFKLTEAGAGGIGAVRMAGAGDIVSQKVNSYIADEVGKVLEEKLSGKGGSKKAGFVDELVELLYDPDRLITIVAGIKNIFSPGADMGLHAVSGVYPPVRRAGIKQSDMGKTEASLLERLETTLNILEQHDPRLVEHLGKLAQLAQNDPPLFRSIISKIDLL